MPVIMKAICDSCGTEFDPINGGYFKAATPTLDKESIASRGTTNIVLHRYVEGYDISGETFCSRDCLIKSFSDVLDKLDSVGVIDVKPMPI